MIYKNIVDLIGNTPMLEVDLGKGSGKVYLKLECFNPSGSIKDRAALYMINDLIDRGIVKKGGTIVEPTSGNTGVALAMIGKALKINVVITMPETMSKERISLMKAYGAEVILTPGSEGMGGAVNKANEISREREAPIAGQFYNLMNPASHYRGTGREILADLGKVDGFIAGVGTGGTISGVGKLLKERDEDAQVWAIEPEESPLISQGKSGPHRIQGLGANFIPFNYKEKFVDKVVLTNVDEAIQGMKELSNNHGILAGISSGANYMGAMKMAKELGEGSVVVTVLPDPGERYLSTGVFDD